MPKAAKFHLY